MNFSPTQLIAQYGYLAVFLGSIAEGESVLLVAGYAAHQGYLDFWGVAALACLGGALGDQTFFLLGRRYGQALLDRFPGLARHASRVDQLIVRYRAGVIVLVRFLYGLRMAGPVIIGMGDTPVRTFVGLNLLGASLWALLVAGLGYGLGGALEAALGDARRYEEAGLGLVLLGAAGLWIFRRGRSRRKDAECAACKPSAPPQDR